MKIDSIINYLINHKMKEHTAEKKEKKPEQIKWSSKIELKVNKKASDHYDGK